jgi:hypothetical protein
LQTRNLKKRQSSAVEKPVPTSLDPLIVDQKLTVRG